MENDSVFSKKESEGKLKISLSAASGALPIADAAVQIKKIDGDGTPTAAAKRKPLLLPRRAPPFPPPPRKSENPIPYMRWKFSKRNIIP